MEIRKTSFAEWAIAQHVATNHYYDVNLPYEFHLKMVVREVIDFKHVIPSIDFPFVKSALPCAKEDILINAAWGHDLIEDTRSTYRDVEFKTTSEVVEIIYALTNEKGKSRSQRANSAYYDGIRNTPGAAFIKMCDRIANVKYGIMTGSDMVKMYKKENENFIEMVYSPELLPLRTRLEKLFELHLP